MALATAYEQYAEEFEAYLIFREEWKYNPEQYCIERLGMYPTTQQRQVLQAIAPDGAKVSVRSGHNTGKDGITSAIILWFMETRDYPRIPCTAPTASQLYSVLWAEIAKWMRKSVEVSRQRGDHPSLYIDQLFKHTNDRLYDISAPQEWFAIARTARKEAPEGLQGFHASDITISEDGTTAIHHGDANFMVIVDEASGVPDEINEVLEGATASPGSRRLDIGNPTKNSGFFALTHRRKTATLLHFKSQDSPLCDPGFRENLARKFGENSNAVRVRADGEFPLQDDDVLISFENTEASLTRDPQVIKCVGPRRMGIDVARFGSDRTTFVVRHDRVVPHIRVHGHQDTMETAGNAVRYARMWDIDEIYVDVVGLGAGVYDRLKEIREQTRKGELSESEGLKADVYEVNVAQSVPSWCEQDDDAIGARLRDYLWIQMMEWFRDEEPILNPSDSGEDKEHYSDMAGELSMATYKIDSNGRIVVERKEDMKKRGALSPDLADGLGCTFAPNRQPVIFAPPTDMTQQSRWR